MKQENSRDDVRKTRRQFPKNKKKEAEKLNNETTNQLTNEPVEQKKEIESNDPLVKIPGKTPSNLTKRQLERFTNQQTRQNP